MNDVQNWGQTIVSPFQNWTTKFVNFLPNLIIAIVILIIGWIISVTVGKLIQKLFDWLKVDQAFERLGTKKVLKKSGIEFSVAKFAGELAKWILFLVFFMAASEILQLPQLAQFLNKILLYLPNVIVAVIIMAIGALLANFFDKLIRGSAYTAGFTSANILGALAKWAIIIFAVLAALAQLKVATTLIQTLFTGVIAMIAIAGGIAFGLGGKDLAKGLLEKLKQDVESKKEGSEKTEENKSQSQESKPETAPQADESREGSPNHETLEE